MPELPIISGDEVIRVLKRLGFYEVRQKGSHVVMRREHKGCVIPRHKEVAVGTLKSALKQAGISSDIFIEAFKK
ncbi:MAG: type II toxin-antitoxin system HicA family toxin [Desulfatiglans sp.]|jgi:predicted RNA binding protein YcfA (HicA-like mRNA interferase family)|nr:type II toxin-antitoxin system HicA family toxin [Desulfatiglans sp.]